MSFPKYKKYKPSGVEWLGDVPEGWSLVKLQWLVQIKKVIAGELGHDVFSVTQNGIRVKDTESGEGQLSLDYSKYQLVEKGQFAMNPMDLLTGGADIARRRGVTSPDYRVFEIRDTDVTYSKYMLWGFQMLYRNHILYAFGQGSSQLGRWRLPRQQFNAFLFPVPPLPEQKSIASFLDVETSKIDRLVGDQRRLIELLKEKRQAVISHAVTKGLDPNAQLKPTGIEWLGDVPEGWEIIRLKTVACEPLKYGANESAIEEDRSNPRYIRITDINEEGGLRADTFRSLAYDVAKPYLLEEGDILLARSGATVGKSFIYRGTYGPACFAGYLIRVRVSKHRCLPDWFNYYCQTSMYWSYISGGQIQATIQNVSAEKYNDIRFPIPPLPEQEAIASYLDEETSKIDGLIDEAERSIELLTERRTALISAAVTGKIDVRGLVDKEVLV